MGIYFFLVVASRRMFVLATEESIDCAHAEEDDCLNSWGSQRSPQLSVRCSLIRRLLEPMDLFREAGWRAGEASESDCATCLLDSTFHSEYL